MKYWHETVPRDLSVFQQLSYVSQLEGSYGSGEVVPGKVGKDVSHGVLWSHGAINSGGTEVILGLDQNCHVQHSWASKQRAVGRRKHIWHWYRYEVCALMRTCVERVKWLMFFVISIAIRTRGESPEIARSERVWGVATLILTNSYNKMPL